MIACGIDTTWFRRNPVLLRDHDPRAIFGRVEQLWIEPRRDGNAACFSAEVLPAESSARVDEARNAIRFGARNGISIGFAVKHYDGRRVRERQTGVTFHETELMEISSVSLHACPTCLIEARGTARACREGSRPVRRRISTSSSSWRFR